MLPKPEKIRQKGKSGGEIRKCDKNETRKGKVKTVGGCTEENRIKWWIKVSYY